ncbi:hypothetical protein OU994_13190 [Pseudoduganella sp. SL102]|uniref:hypothetical protein n=1 Tax=Pseudoduganella sp. SL102 TaxID=2995154 RepID=UPI00248C2675|nr:hypothetical protein [Pseudoduganella sp. SL102]WBS05158.1 hypothetical protein OU994_13190 [Pseudoduganella sp. SL102]
MKNLISPLLAIGLSFSIGACSPSKPGAADITPFVIEELSCPLWKVSDVVKTDGIPREGQYIVEFKGKLRVTVSDQQFDEFFAAPTPETAEQLMACSKWIPLLLFAQNGKPSRAKEYDVKGTGSLIKSEKGWRLLDGLDNLEFQPVDSAGVVELRPTGAKARGDTQQGAGDLSRAEESPGQPGTKPSLEPFQTNGGVLILSKKDSIYGNVMLNDKVLLEDVMDLDILAKYSIGNTEVAVLSIGTGANGTCPVAYYFLTMKGGESALSSSISCHHEAELKTSLVGQKIRASISATEGNGEDNYEFDYQTNVLQLNGEVQK